MALMGTDIHLAASLLQAAELVAIPTETVYGLAGNALDDNAVRKIYAVKERPAHNPLILHIAGKSELAKYVSGWPAVAEQLMDRFWPGPLTLLLSKKPLVPDTVTAGSPRVAVRVPAHPLTLELLKILPFPLAAPSANPFGYISPTTPEHVQAQIGDKIPYILDGGPCQQGVESTIIGFEGDEPVLYRYGALPPEDIEAITGSLSIYIRDEQAPQAPGMLLKHYAPHTPFVLTDDLESALPKFAGKKVGLLLFSEMPVNTGSFMYELLSANADLKEAASHLYAAMHRLDNAGLDMIIAEKFPDTGLGKAINDRLLRAASH